MRGADRRQTGIFSYVSLEARVPQDHPLRPARVMVDRAVRAHIAAWMKGVGPLAAWFLNR